MEPVTTIATMAGLLGGAAVEELRRRMEYDDGLLFTAIQKGVEHLSEKGIPHLLNYIADNYIGVNSVYLNFGHDVSYLGNFQFDPGYSWDNLKTLSILGPNPYGYKFNKSFQLLHSGKLVGKGIFVLPTRDYTFDLDFKNGYYAPGKSIAIQPDGGFYKGDISNGMPKYGGHGQYIYPDGSEYDGQWDVGGPSDLAELKKYDPHYHAIVLRRGGGR